MGKRVLLTKHLYLWLRELSVLFIFFHCTLYQLHYIHHHQRDMAMRPILINRFRHRSLTLHFEQFRFWLQTCGDIRNRKSAIECFKENFPHWWLWESSTPWLDESESRWLPDLVSRGVANSPARWVRESLCWVRESLFNFFKIYHRLTEL